MTRRKNTIYRWYLDQRIAWIFKKKINRIAENFIEPEPELTLFIAPDFDKDVTHPSPGRIER